MIINSDLSIGAINVQSSKLIRKRLEQNKLSITDLLNSHNSDFEQSCFDKVVLYDYSTVDIANMPSEHFLLLLVKKLKNACFKNVFYLKGLWSF